MPLPGFPVGEDREVARRLVEPGELEPGIARGAFRRLGGEGGGVGGGEIAAHRGAPASILDRDKAPGLAEPDRGRERRDLDQPLERAGRQRIGAKPPHVAPPGQQRPQAGAKRVVKGGR